MADDQLPNAPTSRSTHQAPPWKIALPFVLFILIVMGTYLIHRKPEALLAAALATVMGAIWTYGAWRVRRDEYLIATSLPLKPPVGKEAVIISRSRQGGCCAQVGYLVATETALWWTPARNAWHAGESVAVEVTQTAELVAQYTDIMQYQIVSGIFGGDAVTLTLTKGVRHLRLLDPTGMNYLLSLLAPETESSNTV